MRLFWSLVKVGIVLAIGVPLAFIVLATTFGILGAVLGLAFLVLRVAVVCAIVWLLFRIAFGLLGGGSGGRKKESRVETLKPLPPVDPHYEAALRELDREFSADSPQRR